jgi:hypothetical protein
MDVSIGEVIIIAAAFAFVARVYFSHQERKRRLEILHEERLAAIEKGIPLPELPLDPPTVGAPQDAPFSLFPGIALLTFGVGSMVAFLMTRELADYWMLPLPFVFMGVGFILYHFFSAWPRLRR